MAPLVGAYRSGEAEYLINRMPARLKDVKDLFLGTGAGSAAYSIIEQGRVDLARDNGGDVPGLGAVLVAEAVLGGGAQGLAVQ